MPCRLSKFKGCAVIIGGGGGAAKPEGRKSVKQARIQDFEMKGEIRERKSENQRNQKLFQCFRDKKKKKKERRRLKKVRGVKIHPFHLPWIRACKVAQRERGATSIQWKGRLSQPGILIGEIEPTPRRYEALCVPYMIWILI